MHILDKLHSYGRSCKVCWQRLLENSGLMHTSLKVLQNAARVNTSVTRLLAESELAR